MSSLVSLSCESYVNLMSQHRPCFRAKKERALNRRITTEDYDASLRVAYAVGLYRWEAG